MREMRCGAARCGSPRRAPRPRAPHSAPVPLRDSDEQGPCNALRYRNRCKFCFCQGETTYFRSNDGKTEKTDVSIPAVAEQRAREDKGGPPRPEGD